MWGKYFVLNLVALQLLENYNEMLSDFFITGLNFYWFIFLDGRMLGRDKIVYLRIIKNKRIKIK